jgi:hypothetical protein
MPAPTAMMLSGARCGVCRRGGDTFLGLALLREHESESARAGEYLFGAAANQFRHLLREWVEVGCDLGRHIYITIAIERLRPPNSSSFRYPFLGRLADSESRSIHRI